MVFANSYLGHFHNVINLVIFVMALLKMIAFYVLSIIILKVLNALNVRIIVKHANMIQIIVCLAIMA